MNTMNRDTPAPTTAPGQRVADGVIVAHLPFTSHRFLGSPSIVQLSGGDYVVSHDVFGKGSQSNETYIYRSSDTIEWHQIAAIPDMFWGGLFVHKGLLYLLGCTTEYGALVIRCSRDGGVTWSNPSDSSTGLLRRDGRFHTAPVPVVENGGRIWRAYEERLVEGFEWGHFGAVLMSADADADLLDAKSWVSTPTLVLPPELCERGVGAWLEGNAVVTPSGEVVNILRAHRWVGTHQQAATLHLSADGMTFASSPPPRLSAMPGGGSKFTIRRDPDGTYWALANTALYDSSPTRGMAARNTLSLISSTDLDTWEVNSVIAHHPDDRVHGYQYCDWQFDKDDIVVICRTAHTFDGRDAHNYHDSNLITLHRVRNYRDSRT